MVKFWRSTRRWIWNHWPWARWKVAYVEDAPEVPVAGRVYIVGGRDYPFQAVLDCPCGCDSAIWLDLVAGDGEHWNVTATPEGVVSLHPSVWRTDGCESHFVLKGGRVRWC